MRVHVQRVREGLHPSEVVVSITTSDGTEFLTIDRRSLEDDSIDIGYPVNERDDQFLIELPRETMTGSWRVWVNKNDVGHAERARAIA